MNPCLFRERFFHRRTSAITKSIAPFVDYAIIIFNEQVFILTWRHNSKFYFCKVLLVGGNSSHSTNLLHETFL